MAAGGNVFFSSASPLIALSLNQPPVSQANFRALALHQRFARLAQKNGFSIFPFPHRHNTAVFEEIKPFFHNGHLIRTVISVDKIRIEQGTRRLFSVKCLSGGANIAYSFLLTVPHMYNFPNLSNKFPSTF